jgi:hypothetical protein
MSKKGEFTGLGLLIYKAVVNMGIQRDEVADVLNISPSTLYNYYKNPPKSIIVLLELSQKLHTNFLLFYQDNEPLKSWFNEKEAVLKNLTEENLALKKEKEYLLQMIDLQKEKLDSRNQ